MALPLPWDFRSEKVDHATFGDRLQDTLDSIALQFPVASENIGLVPHVRAYKSANQLYNAGVAAAVALGAEDYDSSAQHDNATNNSRLTCVAPGLYSVSGSMHTTVGTGGFPLFYVQKNGAVSQYGHYDGGSQYGVVSDQLRLAVGDYVELYFNNNTAGALTIDYAVLAMHWVCP